MENKKGNCNLQEVRRERIVWVLRMKSNGLGLLDLVFDKLWLLGTFWVCFQNKVLVSLRAERQLSRKLSYSRSHDLHHHWTVPWTHQWQLFCCDAREVDEGRWQLQTKHKSADIDPRCMPQLDFGCALIHTEIDGGVFTAKPSIHPDRDGDWGSIVGSASMAFAVRGLSGGRVQTGTVLYRRCVNNSAL